MEDLEARRAEERRPVEEAGGGVSEGFEQAEAELERAASHEDPAPSPEDDAFPPEAESDAEYGEADQLPPEDA
jgi:hypothetical protein